MFWRCGRPSSKQRPASIVVDRNSQWWQPFGAGGKAAGCSRVELFVLRSEAAARFLGLEFVKENSPVGFEDSFRWKGAMLGIASPDVSVLEGFGARSISIPYHWR